MRIFCWSGRHNLLVHLLPRRNVSTLHCPHQHSRREWQFTHSHITSVRHLYVLSIVTRHASLHIDQIPLRIDLVHLHIISTTLLHHQVLHRAPLVAHLTGHLLPLERLTRVLRLTHRPRSHLPLARGAQRAVRYAHAVRRAETCEAPTSHHTLEAFALWVRMEKEEYLRDALDVDPLAGNEVAACNLRA